MLFLIEDSNNERFFIMEGDNETDVRAKFGELYFGPVADREPDEESDEESDENSYENGLIITIFSLPAAGKYEELTLGE